MAEFRRPALITADPREVSDFLIGVFGPGHSIRQVLGDALYITIDQTAPVLDAALATYTPVAAVGQYRPPLKGDLPAHVAHLAAIRSATPAQLAAMTDAQVRHALQDVVKALALLIDDRLG